MTTPSEQDLPVSRKSGTANAVLVGGPLAGRAVHVPDLRAPFRIVDDHGRLQEYRPDGNTAYSEGHDIHLQVFRHFAPVS